MSGSFDRKMNSWRSFWDSMGVCLVAGVGKKKREKRKQEKKVEVWFEFGFLGLFSWIGFSFGLGVI